jgi:two-component system chemotaxis response regulator CheB
MKLRVLIADDSLFMRAAIKKLLERDARFEVIGEAKDGRDAVEKVRALRPDVCTMDFNMPVLDGAQAVREIMRAQPTPIVMLSAHTREGARETFAALDAGAVDFVTKPSGEVSAELGEVAPTLIAKLLAAAQSAPQPPPAAAPPAARRPASGPRASISPAAGQPTPSYPAVGQPTPSYPAGGQPAVSLPAGGQPALSFPTPGLRVVVVAVSTGGPAALARLLPLLPADGPHALLVVQHLPAGFTAPLAERLDGLSQIRVREAADGDRPGAGQALIAPGDRHLEVHSDGRVHIVEGPEVNGVRPSADVTMRAAARVYGRRTIGVVMTGMGRDGADGIRAIKAAGGVTFVQDQASCVIYGMPRAAVETGCVDHIVPLDELAAAIARS